MIDRAALFRWIDATLLELGRQFRFSYLPPLMVYLATGVSGLTAIVGTFFVKDHLGLSASFLASLAFWAGIPWALKVPLGHLVDLIWRRKALLVYFGAALIALSVAIMYGLIAHTGRMAALAASSLGTRYLNQIFVVTREVRAGGAVTVPADYGELGWLLITAAALTVMLPLLAVVVVQASPLRTRQ